MDKQKLKTKIREWLWHYAKAELLGTVFALAFAWLTYTHTQSYLAAAGLGFVGEGIGFYGYFVVGELRKHGWRHQSVPLHKRLPKILTNSGTNLFVEFAFAEVIDNIFIRPAAIFIVPQYIKPYALGFIVGKLGSDVLFYVLAIAGYEAKKRWF